MPYGSAKHNSACNCCQEPPTPGLAFEYASVAWTCQRGCGMNTGFNTSASFNPDGTCASPANTYSPQRTNDRKGACWPQLYLKQTNTQSNGLVQIVECTRPENSNNCNCTTRCNPHVVAVADYESTKCACEYEEMPGDFNYSGDSECTSTVTTITTFAEDCSFKVTYECDGTTSHNSSSFFEPDMLEKIAENCSGSLVLGASGGCEWQTSGSFTYTNSLFPEENISESYNLNSCCPAAPSPSPPCEPCTYESSQTISPPPTCTNSYDYSDPSPKHCFPKDLPDFPDFINCVDSDNPFSPSPPLQSGQGRQGAAFKFENPYNPDIISEQKFKVRLRHHAGGTCYLKVWIRKVVQKYKFEDCGTGFPGDPAVPEECHRGTPRIPNLDPCNETTDSQGRTNFNCHSRWSTDGPPTKTPLDEYEWEGSGNPCYKTPAKRFDTCANKYEKVYEVTADNGTEVSLEYKYSYLKEYEPNWPDICGSQGCKPNGYPNPVYELDSSKCPEYGQKNCSSCANYPVGPCFPCS
jgi:hypothetical protein